MPKTVNRYYVDDKGKGNVVIRDRISPLGELTYPTDIAVEITDGMFGKRNQTKIMAEQICDLLNEI